MNKYMSKLIVVVIAILMIGVIMTTGCIEEKPDQTYKLYSLNTITGSSGTTGGFLIGYGRIDEEAYYFYYVQDLEGAYHLKKSYADGSRIFMDTASDTAYVTVVNCMNNTNRGRQSCSGGYVYGYDFHVPQGTITVQFNGNADRSVNGV